MTQLVEDITIRITLNHCEAESTVLGGERDLRKEAWTALTSCLPYWIESRSTCEKHSWIGGSIEFENTGLYEAPELGGGDN